MPDKIALQSNAFIDFFTGNDPQLNVSSSEYYSVESNSRLFYFALWLVDKTCVTFSPNEKQNQSWIARLRFGWRRIACVFVFSQQSALTSARVSSSNFARSISLVPWSNKSPTVVWKVSLLVSCWNRVYKRKRVEYINAKSLFFCPLSKTIFCLQRANCYWKSMPPQFSELFKSVVSRAVTFSCFQEPALAPYWYSLDTGFMISRASHRLHRYTFPASGTGCMFEFPSPLARFSFLSARLFVIIVFGTFDWLIYWLIDWSNDWLINWIERL